MPYAVTFQHSSMKCIRFDVCKFDGLAAQGRVAASSMKCIRFDVCKHDTSCVTPLNLDPQ